ncbi:hypothetical protein [Pseudonocardia sp. ICBG1293]|uniref:hypothetical protein n=1 Tax=Pseudonocardia sp. ICBG1293 TaxID=2844382 RepID=UPI001CCD05A8|nr:hypothetical protein [Pseudonocardia sp. ICBG1293]
MAKVFGLTRKSILRGWPLVGLIGVGLTVVALAYGGVTGNLETTGCRVVVQGEAVTVRSAPGDSAAPVRTLPAGTEIAADTIVDGGFRKLTEQNQWVPVDSVAATSGSRC